MHTPELVSRAAILGRVDVSEEFLENNIDRVDWDVISRRPGLSEDFIRRHDSKINWRVISRVQKLPEQLIDDYADRLDWWGVLMDQSLSEPFLEKHRDKSRDWGWLVSVYQQLSDSFIRKYKDALDWKELSKNQILSEEIKKEFADRIDFETQNKKHTPKTYAQKYEEAQRWAEKYGVKIDSEYIYPYRNHDKWGRGMFNTTIIYKPGIYYRDWRCDMDENEENSFGYGIWPKGNTPVRVKISDWGVAVKNDPDGKARVWGFEIIE